MQSQCGRRTSSTNSMIRSMSVLSTSFPMSFGCSAPRSPTVPPWRSTPPAASGCAPSRCIAEPSWPGRGIAPGVRRRSRRLAGLSPTAPQRSVSRSSFPLSSVAQPSPCPRTPSWPGAPAAALPRLRPSGPQPPPGCSALPRPNDSGSSPWTDRCLQSRSPAQDRTPNDRAALGTNPGVQFTPRGYPSSRTRPRIRYIRNRFLQFLIW
jgi:hypothetical protein